MAKKKQAPSPRMQDGDKPATLKDLLGAETVAKLKAQAEALKAEETRKRELKREQEEQARRAEQKQLENDFEYLLKNDKQNWKDYK